MPSHPVGDRGQFATSPLDIPTKGWWQVARRVFEEISAHNLSIVAAGVAFYGMLAIFPAIGAMVTMYGLVADPGDVNRHLAPLRELMPVDAYAVIEEQLQKVVSGSEAGLTIGLIVSLAIALWSSTKGTKALITAMNIAYDEREKRSFVRLNVVAILFTAAGIVFSIAVFTVIAAIPAALELIDTSDLMTVVILVVRWVVMALLVILGLAIVYRYAPHRESARIQWVTPGALAATVLWLLASFGFSIYVTHFGSYNETFGSLGAGVTLLMWFYLSAYIVCLGAELNAELEKQTYRDSTTGPPQPAGQRGAYVADHTVESG